MRMKNMKNINIFYRKYIFLIWILAVIIMVLSIGYIGLNVWEKYKDSIIEKQKEQMMIITDSIADNMEESILGYYNDLNYVCQLVESQYSSSTESDWKESVLNTYYTGHNGHVKDILCYDVDGRLIYHNTDYSEKAVFDSYSLENDVEMCVVQSNDGIVYFVLEKSTADGLRIKLVIDTDAYYQKMISDIRLGTNGYVVLKDEAGVILMHPKSEQLGRTVIEGRKALYGDLDLESLENLMDFQVDNSEGIFEYYSYWWTDPNMPRVKKISAHNHAIIGNGFIIVSTVMDYDDIYTPLNAGYRAILVTFGAILFILVLFATTITIQIVRGRRNKAEIEYLKDLNEVLEETKKGEELIAHQQRLQIMGTMTGGIAHEFNNLLTPIMGYSEMLMDQLPQDSEEADFAKEIFEASDKAKEIIRQLAGLSRKNMETVYTFVPIKKAIRRSIKMVRSVCPPNIQFISNNSFTNEGFLGNETQFNQVILNICVNAFHAIGTDKDGVVTVYGEAVSREDIQKNHNVEINDVFNDFLCIRVEDTGCGMTKGTVEKIFDPFFTTKTGGQGTGLGLSVVEQIIRSHNGYIFVDSFQNIGTIFYIYLPKSSPIDSSSVSNEGKKVYSMNFLAVDDNGKVLRLLQKDFKKLGINIDTINNIEDAKNMLDKKNYDVVLIDEDISKDGKEDVGLKFAMSIGSQYPEIIKIVMTNQVKKEIIEAKQHGFIDAYVEKPVSDARILEEIHKVYR